MKLYIVKPGRSLSTAKGIVGPPVDPEKPTVKEIITVKHFKNGQKGLDTLLASKKCPIVNVPYVNKDDKSDDKSTDSDREETLKQFKESIDRDEEKEKKNVIKNNSQGAKRK